VRVRPIVLLGVLLSADASYGASRTVQPTCSVRVSYTGDDGVGTRLALVLKERIRKSPLYRLTDSDTDWMFGINLVTHDLALPSENGGDTSAMAVAFVLKDPSGDFPKQLNLGLLVVRTSHIVGEAERLLGNLETYSSGLREFCK
jgi:hypothetical protein